MLVQGGEVLDEVMPLALPVPMARFDRILHRPEQILVAVAGSLVVRDPPTTEGSRHSGRSPGTMATYIIAVVVLSFGP